jgi:hypothetical protein
MANDNLVLEHLRAIRRQIDGLADVLAEHGQRLNRIEQGIAGLRRDQAYDAENAAHHSIRIDQLAERVSRIERQLELVDE